MEIDQDLISQLNNNQREIVITETEELLAAWLYKKSSSSKRSKNMSAVPTGLRCSHPNCDASELHALPCFHQEKGGPHPYPRYPRP
jgi:hypothetical protein